MTAGVQSLRTSTLIANSTSGWGLAVMLWVPTVLIGSGMDITLRSSSTPACSIAASEMSAVVPNNWTMC